MSKLFKFWKSYFFDQFTLHLGGGGGGGPTQTTSTVQNTNVPEYARPYVETMLGATQQQLFQGSRGPSTTNPETGEVTQGDFNITGFKPYQAYGGTYDQQGKQLSYDPGKAIAGFQPLQETAQRGIGNMQVPTQAYGSAQRMVTDAATGAGRSAQQALGYGAMGQQAGMQGQQSGMMGQQYGMQAGDNAAMQANAQMGLANQYGMAGYGAGQTGQNLGIMGGANYGGQGAGYGQQAAQLAGNALGYGQNAADIGQMGLRAQGMGENVSRQAQNYARQAAGAGSQYAQQATDPNAIQAYMSPYMQNVVDVQNKEAQRNAAIAGTQQQAEATRAGAFGGSRDAIMRAERERNLSTLMNQNQAQGLQNAYQQAQQAQQYGANLNLQGLQGAQQGLGTSLQGGQLGLSGVNTALQGQQGALSGVGQAGAMYGLGMQGAQTGLQGVNAQLAGTAQGMQGAQSGLAGVNAATNAGQYGLQGAQVGLQGTAQGMQGAGYGLQGAQAGLAGVQGAQAGYNMLGQQGANYTNMLGQQQQNQLGLYGAQQAVGAQQQALEQQKINQAMQDYANAQQYPLMQLGTMSNMLRGLPMQASSTQQYQAAPNQLSQAIGTIGSGASIYNAFKPPGGAAGGLPSEFKYAKGGGIMSYDMGGEVESQLENMDDKGLEAQAKESSSPSIRKMAQRILRERQMSKQSQGAEAMGVQYQAPTAPAMRGGGIIAFQQGAGGNGAKSAIEEGGDEEARIGMQERLAMPPTTGGIMGATSQPTTPVPFVPQAGRSVQQAKDIPDFMKAEYADAEKRAAAPLSSFMAERKAAMQEAGVADLAEGQQQQRASLMAERASMSEEKERQKHLRMAEFFANWGSTPGPTLVAGMNALKQSVPTIISDEKEQKKARKEIDKSIADLDNATRLEKRGEVDAAMALKLKAAEDMKALNLKFIDYQSRRESDASSAAASKYGADKQFESEQLRANTAKLERIARRETDDDNKRFNTYSVAAQNEQRVINKITDQASSGQYKKDLDDISSAKMAATDEKGNYDPAKVPAPLRPKLEAAEARVAAQQEIWTKQKEQAARDTQLAYDRVRINPAAAAKDYTKSTSNAAPADGSVSGEFSAPTAAHIAALKANPQQKAAFDAKFGPGAADEYLRK